MRRLRWGMVGGGMEAFIGAVHRMAARLDDRYDLLAGCLSSTPERAHASAAALGLDPARSYGDFAAMARAEAARPDGIEVVSIVTPNASHAPIARAFLDAGIHVICDKPLATSLSDAQDLAERARRAGLLLGVTYNYSGYPLIRHARDLVRGGAIGRVRLVRAEFALGWLATRLETEGAKQAVWRTDPAIAGPSGVIADLGTHAMHLASFVTGLEGRVVACDLATMVDGRAVEDDASIRIAYDDGARGDIWVSMVAAGERVGLRLRVYGETGMLAWAQSQPDEMALDHLDGRREILTRGAVKSPVAKAATRLVAGLPEGFVEAFANLYRDYADIIAATREGRDPAPEALLAPRGEDGVAGVAFVEAALAMAGRRT